MNDDFEKLASHDKHENILASFLMYRVPKATKSQIFDILDRCSKKKLTAAVALDELADINAHSMTVDVSKSLPEKHEQKNKVPTGDYDENRISSRIRDLESFKTNLDSLEIKQYLDIGCGSGVITVGLGEYLKVPKDAIYGADITTWAGHKHDQESIPGFKFLPIDTGSEASPKYSISLPDNTCQFITLLMVLHHVRIELLPMVFREITRLLAPDGLVLIREHDSPNEMVDSLINIEHGVFEVVIERLTSGAEFGKSYFGKYRTSREWRSVFIQFGFIHLGSTKPRGATRGYYSLFQHSKQKIAPIDAKQTPELIKDLQNLGASTGMIKAARNDADIKQMIIGGRRELLNPENRFI